MKRLIFLIILFLTTFIFTNCSITKVKAQAVNEQAQITAVNPEYDRLQKELNRYYEIQKNGGWKNIASSRKKYNPGVSDIIIPEIKQRLITSGDFDSKDLSPLYSNELVSSVKKVQRQFGFNEDGIIDPELIKELNVPVEKRIEQIQVNLERMRDLPAESNGTRLVANIPEYTLHVYEGTNHVFDMPIVVGTQTDKTVVFNDELTHIVFSPYWHVPESIVREEILPAIRRNRNYLSRNNMERTGTENGLPVIRQKPGKHNALGLVKFVFPNNHKIYFHDTPSKTLFEKRKRAFSHGCIRLSEPSRLAEYLLRNTPGWTPAAISDAMHSGKEQTVKLETPVFVNIIYITAWVDRDGLLHFREDIYGRDKQFAKK